MCRCFQIRDGGGRHLLHCSGQAEGEGLADVQGGQGQKSDRGPRGRGGETQQQVIDD